MRVQKPTPGRRLSRPARPARRRKPDRPSASAAATGSTPAPRPTRRAPRTPPASREATEILHRLDGADTHRLYRPWPPGNMPDCPSVSGDNRSRQPRSTAARALRPPRDATAPRGSAKPACPDVSIYGLASVFMRSPPPAHATPRGKDSMSLATAQSRSILRARSSTRSTISRSCPRPDCPRAPCA